MNWLLLLIFATFTAALFIPICDPLIDGFNKGSCFKVSVIYDPRHEGDIGHCVCEYIIKQNIEGLEGLFYVSKLKSCAFGEYSDANRQWNKNDCTEVARSPSSPVINDTIANIRFTDPALEGQYVSSN